MRKYINPSVVFTIFACVILILMNVTFSDNVDVKNNPIVKAIYLIFPLVGLMYGYISSKYYFVFHLSMSSTRKEIYFDFMKNVICGLIYAISIIILFILFNLLLNNVNSFSEVFSNKYLILFVASYLFQTSLGYFNGIYKLKDYIFIILMVLVNLFNISIYIFNIDSYIVSFIYLGLSLILIYFNYYISLRIKV